MLHFNIIIFYKVFKLFWNCGNAIKSNWQKQEVLLANWEQRVTYHLLLLELIWSVLHLFNREFKYKRVCNGQLNSKRRWTESIEAEDTSEDGGAEFLLRSESESQLSGKLYSATECRASPTYPDAHTIHHFTADVRGPHCVHFSQLLTRCFDLTSWLIYPKFRNIKWVIIVWEHISTSVKTDYFFLFQLKHLLLMVKKKKKKIK